MCTARALHPKRSEISVVRILFENFPQFLLDFLSISPLSMNQLPITKSFYYRGDNAIQSEPERGGKILSQVARKMGKKSRN